MKNSKNKNMAKNKKQPSTSAAPHGKGLWEKAQAELTYPLLLIAVAAAVSMAVINSHDGDTLFRAQELDLFLYSRNFLHQHTDLAGGLLVYVGSYFTQFCYHPWLGSLLLVAWCALLAVLTWQAFSIPVRWAPVVLVPMALILLADFTLGYWIFYVKMHGHLFVAPIGFALAVATVWLFRVLPGKWRLLLLAAAPVVLYPLAGFYGLLATVLMVVVLWSVADVPRSWKVGATVVALLLVVGVPLVGYRYVYCRTGIGLIWTQALPLFSVGERSFKWHYLPYVLMCLLLLVLALSLGFKGRVTAAQAPAATSHRPSSLRLLLPLHLVVIAAMGYATWHFWYKDKNFHRELQVAACLDRADWQGILDVVFESDDEPTRMMVMSKNLAVFKLGQAGNQLYNYREGAKEPASDVPVLMVQTSGKPVYMHYGIVNFCYRWCMEDGVEYGWKVEYLKDMLRCSVINGEKVMAHKYIDLLRQTRYHADWANHYEPLLESHEKLAEDPELGPILPLMDYPSTVASDRSFMEMFLLTMLSGLRSTNPVCTDLALMASMQQKDIPTFWRAFFPYAQTHVGQPMPRHYQEAAYLYGHLENKVDISHMPFDKSIEESYQQFMDFARQCQGMDELQMRDAFYPRFGNTFYYNYFLFHNLKTN